MCLSDTCSTLLLCILYLSHYLIWILYLSVLSVRGLSVDQDLAHVSRSSCNYWRQSTRKKSETKTFQPCCVCFAEEKRLSGRLKKRSGGRKASLTRWSRQCRLQSKTSISPWEQPMTSCDRYSCSFCLILCHCSFALFLVLFNFLCNVCMILQWWNIIIITHLVVWHCYCT